MEINFELTIERFIAALLGSDSFILPRFRPFPTGLVVNQLFCWTCFLLLRHLYLAYLTMLENLLHCSQKWVDLFRLCTLPQSSLLRIVQLASPEYDVKLTRLCPGYDVKLTRLFPGYDVKLTRLCPEYDVKLAHRCSEYDVKLTRLCPGYDVKLTRLCPGYDVKLARLCPGYDVKLTCLCPGRDLKLVRCCPGHDGWTVSVYLLPHPLRLDPWWPDSKAGTITTIQPLQTLFIIRNGTFGSPRKLVRPRSAAVDLSAAGNEREMRILASNIARPAVRRTVWSLTVGRNTSVTKSLSPMIAEGDGEL